MSDNLNQLKELSNKASRSTVAVIDAVTQRGGFKGEELSTIGLLRDQCIQIIQLSEAIQQEDAMNDSSDQKKPEEEKKK
tara:strand:+ start:4912 stop:5148 length:237 start_codon:yes stop_codon:yes gene_type:complete